MAVEFDYEVEEDSVKINLQIIQKKLNSFEAELSDIKQRIKELEGA